jgi:predicted membrane protein
MPQIIMIIVIYFCLATIPNKNLVSINLCVIIPIMLYKIYNKNLNIKDWTKTILITIAFTTAFIILYRFLGTFGMIGIILTLIILISWRIIKGWKLYNYTTKWGSDYLRGKSYDFDIKQLEPEKIRRK